MLRHWLSKLLAICLAVTPASAQEFNIFLPYNKFASCTPNTPAGTELSQQTSTSNANSYTFSSVDVGAVACGAGNVRVIVVYATCGNLTAGNTIDVTIDGAAMTTVAEQGATTHVAGMHHLQVDTVTTAEFIMTAAGVTDTTCERGGMGIWRVETNNATPLDSGEDEACTTGSDQCLISNIAESDNGAVFGGSTNTDTAADDVWTRSAGAACDPASSESFDLLVEVVFAFSGAMCPAADGASTTNDWTADTTSGTNKYGAVISFDGPN